MNTENQILIRDVAICLDVPQNQVCAACYDSQGKMMIRRFPVRETIHAEILSWHKSQGHKMSGAPVFRFVPNLFMEQTRVAMLDGEVLALSDAELTDWLVNASAKGTSGLDGKPIFETSLQKSAYDFTRLPNQFISLTELPREAMELTRHTLLQIATPSTVQELDNIQHYKNAALPEFSQAVETRLRVVARYLIENDREFFTSLRELETVAFFAFTPEGVGFALWNPAYGFHVELGEFFHLSVDDDTIPAGM
ncbi:MAG TPA: hypothetical protein VK308_13785, partial [Pyrinomonadaceae bacterium]|nr:hypothetical protein [Pyrinomonadaceae bacterium]